MLNMKFVIGMFIFFFFCIISMVILIYFSLESIANIIFVVYIITFPFLFFYIVFVIIRSEQNRRCFTKITKKNFIPLIAVVLLIFAVMIFSNFHNINVIGIVFALAFFIGAAMSVFKQYYLVKKSKNILIIIPIILWNIGIIGSISGFYVKSVMFKIIPDSFEMPLGDLKGLAVDSEGNIFCGAHYYSRFQVYDREGRFLYGKCFDSGGGSFKIKINSNDQLEIMVYRGDKKFIFDKDGTLLSHRVEVPDYDVGFENINNYECYDQKRDIRYKIKPLLFSSIFTDSTSISPFGSQVFSRDASGKEKVIIKTPFFKWIFMGPFPSFLFIVVSVFLLLVIDKDVRNEMSIGMGSWKSKE